MDTRPEPMARETEGKRSLSTEVKVNEVRAARKAGRPKGSKNKAKALITNELAQQMLLVLEDTLPEDDMAYLRQVVREGKAVSTEREAKMMLAMLRANLLPVMIEEMQGEKIVDPEGNVLSVSHKFRSDVTDRLKVFLSLLNTIAGIEKKNDKGTDTSEKPVFEVFARRSIDAGRLKILVGYESGSVGGDSDGVGGTTSDLGAIPDQLPQRQIDLPDSEQVETTWVLDADFSGNDSLSDNEEEQGR